MSEIGARIRQLRKELSLTQQQFADKARVHRAYLADIERGVRDPSFNMLKAVFDTYKVSSDWLLTGEGPMYRQQQAEQQAPAQAPQRELSESEWAMVQMVRKLPKEEQVRMEGRLLERKQFWEMQEKMTEMEKLLKKSA